MNLEQEQNGISHPGRTNFIGNSMELDIIRKKDNLKKYFVKKGDVIKCPPNIPHWHGASTDTAFVQVAITGREKGETIWLEPVSDEQYNH